MKGVGERRTDLQRDDDVFALDLNMRSDKPTGLLSIVSASRSEIVCAKLSGKGACRGRYVGARKYRLCLHCGSARKIKQSGSVQSLCADAAESE